MRPQTSTELRRGTDRRRPSILGMGRAAEMTLRSLLSVMIAATAFLTGLGFGAPARAYSVPETTVWAETSDFETNSSTTHEPTTRQMISTVRVPGSIALPGTIVAVAAGSGHTLGLKSDRTVVAAGDDRFGQCDVAGWTGIVAISAGAYHSLGLRSDGTVVATGDDRFGQCDVSGWTGIVAISAGTYHSLGLRSDGTMVATGDDQFGQCDVAGWTGITAISAGGRHSLGLAADGTVMAAGNNDCNQCDVSGWADIVAIAAGSEHSLGLHSDGTATAVGQRPMIPCGTPARADNTLALLDVSTWTDIVAIEAGAALSLGLKSGGSVLACGADAAGQTDVSTWTDVTALSAGYTHSVAISVEGACLAAGTNLNGESDVSNWAALDPGITLGTIGGTGSAVGLRTGTSEAVSRWTALEADFEPLAEGQAVKFAVRQSDDGVAWSKPLGRDGAPIDWTDSAGNYFGASATDSTTFTDLGALPVSNYIDIVVRLESHGRGTPVLHSVSLVQQRTDLVRIQGVDRYQTAIEISKRGYPEGADAVIIVTGSAWPDALSGGALSGAVGAPLLLATRDMLNAGAVAEIERLGAVTAYILGGFEAIGPEVEAQLRSALHGGTVVRLAGADRYETAKVVANRVIKIAGSEYDGNALVTTGGNFPDALAASSFASRFTRPLILADPRADAVELPSAVSDVIVLGGTRAVSAAVEARLAEQLGDAHVRRLGGSDRYETASILARASIDQGMKCQALGIATGENFPDALTGGAMLGALNAPLLLTPGTALNANAALVLADNAAHVSALYIIGGTRAVSEDTAAQAEAASAP